MFGVNSMPVKMLQENLTNNYNCDSPPSASRRKKARVESRMIFHEPGISIRPLLSARPPDGGHASAGELKTKRKKGYSIGCNPSLFMESPRRFERPPPPLGENFGFFGKVDVASFESFPGDKKERGYG
jgi:hypothetical protein